MRLPRDWLHLGDWRVQCPEPDPSNLGTRCACLVESKGGLSQGPMGRVGYPQLSWQLLEAKGSKVPRSLYSG